MKKLSVYIFENQDILITEGKWLDKLKSFFGFDSEKVNKTFNDLSDKSRLDFATLQYLAAQSKDSQTKKDLEQICKSAEEDKKALLKQSKLKAQEKAKFIKELQDKGKNLSDFNELCKMCLELQQLISSLAEELNDNEGKTLAENFKKVIDKTWPDDLEKETKELEDTKKKVEQSGVAKKEENNNIDTSKISAAITKTAKEQGLDNFLAALKTSLGEMKNFENIGDKAKVLDEIIQKL